MQQLKIRVLTIGADVAPHDRSGCDIDFCTIFGDALAIAFHIELLQIGGKLT